MNSVDEIRYQAQQKARRDKSSGSALLWVALSLPMIGGGVGYVINASPFSPIEKIEQIDEADLEKSIERAKKLPGVKRQIKLAENAEHEALVAELHKYNRTLSILAACRKMNPKNRTYDALTERYMTSNKSAERTLREKESAITKAQIEKFQQFSDKVKDGNQVKQTAAIVKFSAGGGAAQYAGTMMRSMATMGGPRVEATPELCQQTVTDISLGKLRINPNPPAG